MQNKNENEELQSRREFFKKAAKAALPVIGAVVVGNLPVMGARTTFQAACSDGTCRALCFGCSGTCQNSCSGTCDGSNSAGNPNSDCHNGCSRSCAGGCSGTCYRTCSGTCSGYSYY